MAEQEKEDHAAIEIIADAIRDFQVSEARKEIEKRKAITSDAREFFKKLSNETEAGLVILSSSYIDTHFTEAFKENLPGLNSKLSKELFEGVGSLSTMSAKIKMAQALKWIDSDLTSDLNTIRKIRNIFAHDPYKAKLENDPAQSLIQSLQPRETKIFERVKDSIKRNISLRERYHVRCAFICYEMITQMAINPICLREGASPSAVWGSYEEEPNVLKHLTRELATFVCALFYDPHATIGQKSAETDSRGTSK